MNCKTIPVAAALLGAVSLSSFAIAATDNVDTAAVRGFDTVASRPAADIPPCPYYDDFGPRHHRMLRSPIMAERYGQQVDEIDNIESQLFVERKVLRALERADNANVQEIRKQAQTVADLESQKREKERLLMQQFVKDGGYDTCPYYDGEYHRGYGPRHHRFRHW